MNDVPSHFRWFQERFPTAAKGYEALGDGVHQSGPLDDRMRALLKVVISGTARLEGGLHAQRDGALLTAQEQIGLVGAVRASGPGKEQQVQGHARQQERAEPHARFSARQSARTVFDGSTCLSSSRNA